MVSRSGGLLISVVLGNCQMRIGVVIIGIAVALLIGSSVSAKIQVDTIPMKDGAPIVALKGNFDLDDDPAQLVRAVEIYRAKLVTFNSDGGNVAAAMIFGRTIRRLGLSTIQLRSSECASACALAFVGGVTRQAEPGSIGVHQSSFAPDVSMDAATAVEKIQAATADLMAYLIEMGVDPKLLQLSLSTAKSDMRYLTSAEMVQYRVTTPDSPNSSDTVSAGGPTSQPQATQPAQISQPGPPSRSAAENQALQFANLYYQAWSLTDSKALSFLQTIYPESLSFYGEAKSKDFIMNEKAAFASRWPIRAYSIKAGTEKVECDTLCRITGVAEWFASSPQRRQTSSGQSEFLLIWNPRTGRLDSESGKVIVKDKGVTIPSRIIEQWHDQNEKCRGGSGDQPETQESCDRRETLGKQLAVIGWCYGRNGEYGYQMKWHRCGQ